MNDFFEQEDSLGPVRNTDRWSHLDLDDSKRLDPWQAAYRSVEFIKQEGVVWRSVVKWTVGELNIAPNESFSWLTGGYLAQLEHQLLEEIERSSLTYADLIDDYQDQIELINPDFREDLNKALIDVKAIHSVLSKCGRIPNDSLHELNLLARNADDVNALYSVRSCLQAYDEMYCWGQLASNRWGMIVELYENENLNLFQRWGRQDWLEIEKLIALVNNKLDEKLGHATVGNSALQYDEEAPTTMNAVSGVSVVEGYDKGVDAEQARSLRKGKLGDKVTASDASRIFSAMMKSKIIVTTWEEVAAFIETSSGNSLSALASKNNTISIRVVNFIAELIEYMPADEREELKKKI